MMISVICRYLTANYHILGNEARMTSGPILRLGVYNIGSENYVFSIHLISELCDIFLISKEDAREYVDFWSNMGRNPMGPKFQIDLKEYWDKSGLFAEYWHSGFLPLIYGDLVPVEELEMPTIIYLHHVDFNYEEKWYNKFIKWVKGKWNDDKDSM